MGAFQRAADRAAKKKWEEGDDVSDEARSEAADLARREIAEEDKRSKWVHGVLSDPERQTKVYGPGEEGRAKALQALGSIAERQGRARRLLRKAEPTKGGDYVIEVGPAQIEKRKRVDLPGGSIEFTDRERPRTRLARAAARVKRP